MTNEIWKDIQEFLGIYQVSNLGKMFGVSQPIVSFIIRGKSYKFTEQPARETPQRS
jgi:hypothetical protein